VQALLIAAGSAAVAVAGSRIWPFLETSTRYLWKDVSSYMSLGAQNPIKYVNC
jgi:hypothetical protein